MSLESLAIEEYGHLLSFSEDDSDEEMPGEKYFSIFASFLDSSSEDYNIELEAIGPEEILQAERNLLGACSPTPSSDAIVIPLSLNQIESNLLEAMNPDSTGASLMQQQQNANAQPKPQPQLNYPVGSSSINSIGAAATVFDDLSSLPPPPPQLQGGATTEATIRCRPQVPPKPQIDLVRYSMANVNKEDDLDAILGELYELEKQLSTTEGSNNLLMGLPTLPISSSQSSQLHSIGNAKPRGPEIISKPQGITILASSNFQSNHSLSHLQPDEHLPPRVNTDFCASPDVDSAFGDSSSTECSSGDMNRYRHSEISSSDSYRGSLNTPSPSHQSSPKSACTSSIASNSGSSQTSSSSADLKAQKIKEALEKMKEAKMKKIYVKIFLEDGNVKGLLIDERWTVLETMKQLAEKLNITLTPEYSIVEEYPDLHIRRIYEDHEFVVENIEDWLADSKNKLYFLRRQDKYNFINYPQHFLLSDKSDYDLPSADSNEWNADLKQQLLKRYVNSSQVPELEGNLYLKLDGKKSWRKYYFVLRSSGLYYCPKAKGKGTKDLQCLMNIYNNQIYTCTDWKKKYKAPTQFGFAIKHPKIQVKTSKYIKYVCTDDEKTYIKWLAALRITRNSFATMHENYLNTTKVAPGVALPVRVEVPLMGEERLSTIMSQQQQPQSQIVNHRQITTPRSPARISVASRNTTSSDHCSTSSIPFEQDDCGTIKRMPYDLMDSAATGPMQKMSLAKNAVAQTYMLRHSSSGSSHGNNSKQSSGNDDDDSDEEHFPPPPEVVLQRTPTPQQQAQMFSNRSSFSSPVPPPIQRVHPTFVEKQQQFINVTPQNQAIHLTNGGGSNINVSSSSSASRKAPPPPPPKRSENTRLVTAAPNGDLYSELQKATALQKRRIEGN